MPENKKEVSSQEKICLNSHLIFPPKFLVDTNTGFKKMVEMQVLLFYLQNYFFSRRLQWLKFDAIFMYLGIIISVLALVTTFIVFEGYERTLKETILGLNSHIYFFRPGINNLSTDDLERISTFLAIQEEVQV